MGENKENISLKKHQTNESKLFYDSALLTINTQYLNTGKRLQVFFINPKVFEVN